MTTESQSGAEPGLPFKNPLEATPSQSESIKMASEPADITLQPSEAERDQELQPTLDELLAYLSKGVDALKGLNLQGFQQIYPVFLGILAAVITGLVLVIASNILTSINHLPVIGGLLDGLFELCGLVVVTRFAASNLLLQKKRADLFVRIAALKKELIGQ